MENGNGADKLIASILEEAHAQASAIEWKSAEAISEIKKRLEDGKEAIREEFTQKAQAARELTLATARTNAELAGRKELLARKRALIDRAFDAARERICALTGAEREELLKKLLSRECEGSEVIRPAPRDRKALETLVSACGVKGLELGADDGAITDGFTVEGANYVKNCSFDSLMEEARASAESEVTKVLFN